MTRGDQIKHKMISLQEIDAMAAENMRIAKLFGLELKPMIKGDVVTGVIKHEGLVIYSKEHKGEYLYNRLIWMHYYWYCFLSGKLAAKEAVEHQTRVAAMVAARTHRSK